MAPHSSRMPLPIPLTVFIGRERELSALESLLANQRLVTLVGAGGIGKSRLALELAKRASVRDSGDGWFIDLAPLSDSAAVEQVVAMAVGIADRAEPSAVPA